MIDADLFQSCAALIDDKLKKNFKSSPSPKIFRLFKGLIYT